jgi:hypothetical protein
LSRNPKKIFVECQNSRFTITYIPHGAENALPHLL